VPVLPAASVEEHETVVVPSANVEPEAGEHVNPGEASTLSLAVAVYVTAMPAGSFVVTLEGPVTLTVGAAASLTVTTKVPAVEVVPSVALQFTVVDPRANVVPESGVQLTGTDETTASAAEAEKLTAAPAALVAGCTMSAGSDKTGPCESWTVTANDAVAMSAVTVSVTVQVTVVEPSGNVLPEVGVHSTGLSGFPPGSVASGLA
jgi:hypothetical protein